MSAPSPAAHKLARHKTAVGVTRATVEKARMAGAERAANNAEAQASIDAAFSAKKAKAKP